MPESEEIFIGVLLAIFFIALAFFSLSEALEIFADVVNKLGEAVAFFLVAIAILGFLYLSSRES